LATVDITCGRLGISGGCSLLEGFCTHIHQRDELQGLDAAVTPRICGVLTCLVERSGNDRIAATPVGLGLDWNVGINDNNNRLALFCASIVASILL